ncbi:MAG: hypothetical protein A2W28_02615 [Gammaproteobacteria bacterium RBG_16_51_14]|nr:MAG: hypothetical protein A2W28_02615 [Gammaproteobacteria bacterium RBG_16_51_14]
MNNDAIPVSNDCQVLYGTESAPIMTRVIIPVQKIETCSPGSKVSQFSKHCVDAFSGKLLAC